MDTSNPNDGFNFIHTVWNGVLSALAALTLFSGRRLLAQLDSKADREDLVSLDARFSAYMVNQAAIQAEDRRLQREQHAANTQRLDRLLERLPLRQHHQEDDR